MRYFSSCNIVEARLRTDRGSGQSLCCGFIEFDDAESLRKALMLHHSDLKGNKITVELTVGGGGRGENRKQKIQAKNEALNQERHKLAERSKSKPRRQN